MSKNIRITIEEDRAHHAPVMASPTNPIIPVTSTSPTRIGKVAITHWVHPAVRKQVQQLGLDHDKDQYRLVDEALNLLFEEYGKPPIA